jgi:uroporphyrinogen-III synthase
MSRAIAVLRPEPGNHATATAIESRGRCAIRLPLFEVVPLAWSVPDPANFDALILTSANTVRQAGPGLAALAGLPVHSVGEATAEAARRAGLIVASVSRGGAAELAADAEAAGVRRALHLAGREHTLQPGGIVASVMPVYASEPLPIAREALARLGGTVALVQSPRAGRRLAELVAEEDRPRIILVAVSAHAAQAVGTGWERIVVAPGVESGHLIDAAIALAD